jgi:flagellin-like hook-associated protein FlgL
MAAQGSVRTPRKKDAAMLTLSSPPASPVSNALERANAAQSASVDASARAAAGARDRIGAANEAKAAATTATAAQANAAAAVQRAPQSLSTLAIVGALNSVPAALSLMNDIVVASASGTLSDADREMLSVEYAQLTKQVASVVGSPSAGAQTSSSKDSGKDDNAQDTPRQTSDDRRSTLTQTAAAAPQVVQRDPVVQWMTTTKSTLVPDGNIGRTAPKVTVQTHELHVGTDSYEPVPVRLTQARPSRPETFGRLEQHVETHRILVAQVAQITQLSQAAHVAPLSAVA